MNSNPSAGTSILLIPIDFKPKFVSKKERERLKRQKEEEEKKNKEKQAQILKNKNKLYQRGLKGEELRDRLEGKHRSTDSKAKREKKREEKRKEKEKEKEILLTNQEIQYIKNNKLGIKKDKRKLQKPSDKFKKQYVDDWNPEDDTSVDINPLFNKKYQAKVLFGKGMIAGIDAEEQKLDKVS